MRILYDHQIYCNQRYGGISRYFYELSKGLASLGNDCRNSVYFSENEYTTDRDLYKSRPFIGFKFRGRERIKSSLNEFVSQRVLKNGGYDIFHPTYYDTYFLKKEPPMPFVVTFYDLIHEKFSGRFPGLLTGMDQVISDRIKMLSRASKVIAISHSTKRDMVDYYGVPQERIHVTHLASSLTPGLDAIDPGFGDYILFVGNRLGYKNFPVFLESVTPLLKREGKLKVVCAGGGGFIPGEVALAEKLGVSGQLVQVPIDDNRLAALYKHALFFVFPSLYEGFGIPALEAFNCGCPAILSNVSSLPEVGGEAALYIDPENPSDILRKCEMLYNDAPLREMYKKKGFEQADKFSWQRVANETLNVYRSAL